MMVKDEKRNDVVRIIVTGAMIRKHVGKQLKAYSVQQIFYNGKVR
jgi:hypothetical protein